MTTSIHTFRRDAYLWIIRCIPLYSTVESGQRKVYYSTSCTILPMFMYGGRTGILFIHTHTHAVLFHQFLYPSNVTAGSLEYVRQTIQYAVQRTCLPSIHNLKCKFAMFYLSKLCVIVYYTTGTPEWFFLSF